MEDILKSYLHLPREDLLTAHSFAAELLNDVPFVASTKLAG